MCAFLKIDRLYGGYGREIVLKDISFDINKGEFLGVIGPNGAGKSTLLKLMSRVLYPQKGSILFEDKDITKINLKELCRKAAFVPQETAVGFPFSVWEMVMMGRIPHLKRLQVETKHDHCVAQEALAMTDSLHLKEKDISRLSAGERQRVIIARALAQEPVLLFLDEPTSHLDIGHQAQILDLLKRLNRQACLTVIMVLHDLNLAGEYCDRLILLNDGRVFKDGTPEEVLTYQNIEEVYRTVVIVSKNPVSSKPYVVVVSEREKCRVK